MTRIKIIMLARNCDSSQIVYNYLSRLFEIHTIVVEENISKKKQFFKRVKLIGFWRAAGQVAFMLLVFPFLKRFSQKRKNEVLKNNNLFLAPLPFEKIKKVKALSSEKAREIIRDLNPDLIIVNGTRIISKKTLECVSAPFINIHTGITPAFRGVHGGYWSIAKGKKNQFGTTIHYVDPGVDTGGIIEQVFIEPGKKDNFYTYPFVQYAAALPVLRKIVESFNNGQKPETKEPITNESSLWFHPTIFQWIFNIGKTFVLSPLILSISLF